MQWPVNIMKNGKGESVNLNDLKNEPIKNFIPFGQAHKMLGYRHKKSTQLAMKRGDLRHYSMPRDERPLNLIYLPDVKALAKLLRRRRLQSRSNE